MALYTVNNFAAKSGVQTYNGYAQDGAYLTAVSTGLLQTVYGQNVFRQADLMNPLGMLMGSEGAPIIDRNYLSGGGAYLTMGIAHDLTQAPTSMDYDTHGNEEQLLFDDITMHIFGIKHAVMNSKWEQLKSPVNLQQICNEQMAKWLTYEQIKALIYTLIGSAYTITYYPDSLTSGEAFAQTVCSNITYPNNNFELSTLSPSDVFTPNMIGELNYLSSAGWRYSTGGAPTKTYEFEQPVVGGRRYKGVILMSEAVFWDLRWGTTGNNFEQWLMHAQAPGWNNPLFAGLETAFEVDGTLVVVLKGKVGALLDIARNTTVLDQDNANDSSQYATSNVIYMGANAMVREVPMRQAISYEDWDGTSFKRTIGEFAMGTKKLTFTLPTPNADRDMGVYLCRVYATQLNR